MNIEIWPNIMKTRLETNQKILTDDFSKSLASLKNHIQDLGNNWQGSDYDYFIKTITPFLDDLTTLEKSLISYHDFLGGYLEAHQKLMDLYTEEKIDLK